MKMNKKSGGNIGNVDFGEMLDVNVKSTVLQGDPKSDDAEQQRALSKASLSELKKLKAAQKNGNPPSASGGHNPQMSRKEQAAANAKAKKEAKAKAKAKTQAAANAKAKGKGKGGSKGKENGGKGKGKNNEKGKGKGNSK